MMLGFPLWMDDSKPYTIIYFLWANGATGVGLPDPILYVSGGGVGWGNVHMNCIHRDAVDVTLLTLSCNLGRGGVGWGVLTFMSMLNAFSEMQLMLRSCNF